MAFVDRVLFDTSAFFAIYSDTDQFHSQAASALGQLADTEPELWTTSYTLVETMALLHRRLGFESIAKFSEWCRGTLETFWVDSRVHNEAWDRYLSSQGQGLSFVDWTTAIASYRLGAHVFTFDSGFARQGLPTVPR